MTMSPDEVLQAFRDAMPRQWYNIAADLESAPQVWAPADCPLCREGLPPPPV
jgi:predicted alternative tryptophan synthase beta-subunit